jgi:hypothetical protein
VEELATIGFAPLNHETVKIADKRQALVDLGKHLGMFTEKHEHKHAAIVLHLDAIDMET